MSFMTSANYFRDGDGFTPPAMGGPLACEFGTFSYADTARRLLFTLPAGAVPVAFITNVREAFVGTLLTAHITHPTGTFGSAVNVGTATQVDTGYVPGSLFTRFGEETPVYAISNTTAATAGTAVVGCVYMLRDS